jgi:hypothetical protein
MLGGLRIRKNVFTVVGDNAYGHLGRYLKISDGDDSLYIVKGKSSKGSVGYVRCGSRKSARCSWRSLVQFRAVKQ